MSALARRLRSLRADRRGVSLIEFALSLPLVVMVIMFGLELANYGLTILKVHQIAATTADNAARVRDSITELDVNETLMGGRIIGQAMDFADRGRIVVSDVSANGKTGASAGQRILWQRCTGKLNIADSQPKYGTEGKGANDATLQAMGAAGRQIAPSANSVLIFTEVTYRYKPLFPNGYIGTPILRSEASFTVRERASETLGAGPSGTDKSVCTRYDL